MRKAEVFKWIVRIFSVVGLAVLIWVHANFYHVKHFPSIISSFYAKTMCSCLFVQGHKEQYCTDYTKQYVPIQKATVSKAQKTVTVKGLWRTNKAKYISKRHGCMLQELH